MYTLDHREERPSSRRKPPAFQREQPAPQNMQFLNFFFRGHFCLSWSGFGPPHFSSSLTPIVSWFFYCKPSHLPCNGFSCQDKMSAILCVGNKVLPFFRKIMYILACRWNPCATCATGRWAWRHSSISRYLRRPAPRRQTRGPDLGTTFSQCCGSLTVFFPDPTSVKFRVQIRIRSICNKMKKYLKILC